MSDRPRGFDPSFWLPFLAVIPLLLLVQRFTFVCDDAFISFRYARHLAEGLGLRYNLGVEPPVEGYSEFLWVLIMSGVERLGGDVTVWSRVMSVASAVALVILVIGFLRERVSTSSWVIAGAALFLATLPTVGVWATGGLATMTFALGVWSLFHILTRVPGRPGLAAAAGVAIVIALLRADGVYWVVLVSLVSLILMRCEGRVPPPRSLLVATGVVVGVFALYLIWRHGYHGAWFPNTARAKVSLDVAGFRAGLHYVGGLLLTVPPLLVVGALAPVLRPRGKGPVVLACFAIALGTLAYSVIVGGDFMAMGRFLLPAMPFAAVLFGTVLEWARGRPGGGMMGTGLVVICCTLSVLPAFDRHPVPLALREQLHFRWNIEGHRTEYEQWEIMKTRAGKWTALGRALKIYTQPGESLVSGAIGAVGYYSNLFIYDRYGLVSREVSTGAARRRSVGHRRHVPVEFFRPYHPTYFGADLVVVADPAAVDTGWRVDPQTGVSTRLIPLSGTAGFSGRVALHLGRWE